MPPLGRHRAARLLDTGAQRSRDVAAERLAELRGAALSIALAAAAAALAWLIAQEAFPRRDAFFAPIAAVLTLGLTVGQRGRRALELGIGVALGLAIADLIVLAIGAGTWQLGVVIALAMAAAVLAGGGPMLVNQAAVSGALVVTLNTGDAGFSGVRFVDALIGSSLALGANALIPVDPLRLARDEAGPLLRNLGAALSDIARALEANDAAAALRALATARQLDPGFAALRQALQAGRETTTIAPSRRRARRGLEPYERALPQIDHAIRNTRVLARRAVGAIEQGERVPLTAIEAIDALAASTPALADYLADPRSRTELEASAVEAAARATAALEVTGNLSANMIVGQVRSLSVDLMGAAGIDAAEARESVRGARLRLGI